MKASQQKILIDRVDKLKKENMKLKAKLASFKEDKRSLQKGLKDTRKLLSEMPGAVILVQGENIVFANEAAWRQLGYTEKELLSQDILSLVHSRSLEHVKTIRKKWALGKPVSDQFEIYMRKKDGGSLCREVNWKKIRYQRGTAFLFNITDPYQRKLKEKQLRQSQKIDAVARMAASLSRDFSRGLKILNEHFSQFQDMGRLESKKVIRSLRRIEAAMEIGDAISRQLNCLAKLKNKQSEVVLFDPKRIVQDAVAIIRPKWEGRVEGDINVKTYLRSLSPVKGHPAELRDAFICLILNAFEALEGSGEIYLTTEENAGFAWFYIQDNGIGIREEIEDKIFDPFFTNKGGSHPGLGLSLANAIINRHGGSIEVISQEGQGATFIVKIPLSQTPFSSEAKRASNRIKDSNILVISDGCAAVDLLLQLFVSKGGKVTAASAFLEGLKLLKRKKFGLVVADIDTPDIEPEDIVPKIKQVKKDLPVVLVNVRYSGKPSLMYQNLRADLILERPLNMDRISSLVSEAIALKTASR